MPNNACDHTLWSRFVITFCDHVLWSTFVITFCYNIMWSQALYTIVSHCFTLCKTSTIKCNWCRIVCHYADCEQLRTIVLHCISVVHLWTQAARLFDIVRFCDIRAQACATCVSMCVASHFPYNPPRIARIWPDKTQLKTMVYNDTQPMRDNMQS